MHGPFIAGAGRRLPALQSLSFVWEAEQLLIRETGLLAFGFFSASFLCTPMNRLAKRSGHRITGLGAWRRSLGLVSVLAALLHVLVIYALHVGEGPLLGAWFGLYAQAGAAALLLLVILAITSFQAPTRWLKIRHWKTLHRLVFAIFFLLLIHIVFGPHLPSKALMTTLAILSIVSWTGRLNP